MVTEPTIAVIGLMGAGKTTVGRLAADTLSRRLVDADTVIFARTGRTVRELWLEGGEDAYRALESDVVLDALAGPDPVVVAVPGGAVLDPRVRAALETAFVVWLQATPTALAMRVQRGDHRPILGNDVVEDFTAMASERDELYGDIADLTIDTTGLEPVAVADRIIQTMKAGSR